GSTVQDAQSRGRDRPRYPARRSGRSCPGPMTPQEPTKAPAGTVRITASRNFSVSTTIAAARIEVEPGAIRELHWHPNADDWQYYLSGQGRMSVFASGGKSCTFDYQAGDVGYVPRDMGQSVDNSDDQQLIS